VQGIDSTGRVLESTVQEAAMVFTFFSQLLGISASQIFVTFAILAKFFSNFKTFLFKNIF
jgi:hypothetical protein